ncbi:MAG TPA: hypothetical protein VN790_10125 [Steroidobacteraceae bacterium]|nr:hypothetical protein [Steroidobacteraceae bacterium]
MSTFVEITRPAVRGLLLGAGLLALIAVGGLALAPAAHAQAQQQVSKAVFDKYDPARAAYQKKDYSTAVRLGKEALAAAKTPFEKQSCLMIVFGAAATAQFYGEAIEAGEQLIALEGVPAATRLSVQKTLATLYPRANRIDKAIAITKDYMKVTGGTPADWDLLAQLYSAQKDCANLMPALDKALAGNKAPEERQLLMQSNCYYKAHDTEKRIAVNTELLRRFPKRDYYNQLLVIYQTDKKVEDLGLLALLRFGYDRDYLDSEADYVKLADLALDVGTTAEAQRVLEKGIAKKLVKTTGKGSEKNTRLLDQAKARAVEDSKTVGQLDAESRAGRNGESDVKLGYRYFSMGQFDKAVEAIQRGLQPDRVARVKRPDEANMVLGIALVKLKKKADADKAFTAAKADPRMAAAATIWMNGT